MPGAEITLLVEDLRSLARALPPDSRYPALERILARGRSGHAKVESANHLRFRVFGAVSDGPLSEAALTHVAASGSIPEGGEYWLRADPVAMRADMTRVFLTYCWLEDFDQGERAAIDRIVRDVLDYEGIRVPEIHAGPWCFPLEDGPDCEFLPLHRALGMNVAEALPETGAATRWKRIMTEIQVELHQCEFNARRRSESRPEMNSVWFWGGGRLPEVAGRRFDTVASNDPVARGLGMLAGSSLSSQADFAAQGGRQLIDWIPRSRAAADECDSLERLAQALLAQVGKGARLVMMDGEGHSWALDRRAQKRFWRRSRPLAEVFAAR